MVHEPSGSVCSESFVYMFSGGEMTQIPWLHKYTRGYSCLNWVSCLFHTICVKELKISEQALKLFSYIFSSLRIIRQIRICTVSHSCPLRSLKGNLIKGSVAIIRRVLRNSLAICDCLVSPGSFWIRATCSKSNYTNGCIRAACGAAGTNYWLSQGIRSLSAVKERGRART